MKDEKDLNSSQDLRIQLIQQKFESVMPEVHRQVKVYEDRAKEGKLTPLPSKNPLFAG